MDFRVWRIVALGIALPDVEGVEKGEPERVQERGAAVGVDPVNALQEKQTVDDRADKRFHLGHVFEREVLKVGRQLR